MSDLNEINAKLDKLEEEAIYVREEKLNAALRIALARLSSSDWYCERDRSEAGINARRTFQEIAYYCGCKRQAIERIERIALRKLRAHYYRNKELARDLSPTYGKGQS
jgi:DNA-directed RNA polymerase sigma subunit (sigma70/sigma32)